MAKDPAFLFYYDRFISGTYTMTNEEVGLYIRLLCIQANKGHVTEKDMKNTSYSSVEDVKKKFIEISPGVYRNPVLFNIMEDRKLFTESRRSNRLGKKKRENDDELVKNTSYSSEKLVVNKNKNENINEFQERGSRGEEVFGKPEGIKPGIDDLGQMLPEIKVKIAVQYFHSAKGIEVKDEAIFGLWEAFKPQHFTGKKFYKDWDDVYSHFLNWTYKQKITDGNSKSGSQKPFNGKNGGFQLLVDKLKQNIATRGTTDNSDKI